MNEETQFLIRQNIKPIRRRRQILKKGSIGLISGALGAVILPYIFLGIAHLFGFGSHGIVKGSIAASIQHSLGNTTSATFECKLMSSRVSQFF